MIAGGREHSRPLLLLLLTLSVGLLCASPCLALPERVSVSLFESQKAIRSIKVFGPVELTGTISRSLGPGVYTVSAAGGALELAAGAPPARSRAGKHKRSLVRVPHLSISSRGAGFVAVECGEAGRRRYPGVLHLSFLRTPERVESVKVVNEVAAPDYVRCVVGSEAPKNFPAAALKAFAVLTLTGLDMSGEAESRGDSTRLEVYKGLDMVTPAVQDAVQAVWERRLVFRGGLCKPFYHSTCAGSTSSGVDIFGEGARGLTYLVPVKCTFCKDSPFWKPRKTMVPQTKLKQVFDGALPVVVRRDGSGRPLDVSLNRGDSRQGGELSGYQAWLALGRALGWGAVPSTRYSFKNESVAGKQFVKITSSGAGHGVGLCQWGAAGLARQGKSFRQILHFYFPDCKVR